MSELAGILAFAVLFILFCALPPRRRADGCESCGVREDEDPSLCAMCPHGDERSEPMGASR